MNDRSNVSVGDRDIALANEIARVEVGSGVHGMAIAGHDDLDLMGVYVETAEQVIGLAPTSGHYVSRTVPEGVRSGPGDVDLTLYSLRKYMCLATQGNPTVLTLLYAPDPAIHMMTLIGCELRALAPSIVSRQAGQRFLGYLNGQRNRMLGVGPRQNRVPNRPELVERYGYDTKYASHALRLGLQGIEMVTHGTLTLPMPAEDLRRAMAVKRGEVSKADALRQIDIVRGELADRLTNTTALPERPDMAVVNSWLIDVHRRHWDGCRPEIG